MRTVRSLLVLGALACSACGTTGDTIDEPEPVLVSTTATATAAASPVPEVPRAVAQAGRPATRVEPGLEEVVVEAPRERHEVILDLVGQARTLLSGVQLDYVYTGKGRRETLRGRPVAFALWSEANEQWHVVHIEIPRPPVRWKPGGKPLPYMVITPGVTATHVKGTGAERLMFSFTRDGEQLKVYGRKFPVFDNTLIARKKWREAVRTATPIVYLPANEDTRDPQFVSDGKDLLLATAEEALEQLRLARVPSVAFPGELLADVVPAQVIAALAVIEQTDDVEYRGRGTAAFEDVLSQYGLKREEAYRYSVSSAKALGPMQFTDRRGNGTYSMVVRRCRGANLDPYFERGATNLLNAMKAAICLFDIELYQMRAEIRAPYRDNPEMLGIFPVAAYNGGPRNVARLYAVVRRMDVKLEDLRLPSESAAGLTTSFCPCLWVEDQAFGLRPVPIPRYNNENRWYVEKYQHILRVLE
jgi:hypothetical protein